MLEQMAARIGRPARDNPDLLRLQLTHADLAKLAGLSRAHVSIMMSRLRDKGLVQYGRSTPLQVNMRALENRRSTRTGKHTPDTAELP